ncbi:hypothetical protein F5Y13DRAFT_192253 [Hypoxylon sp. FL1857]|nr:hypothetical protein F5Y13DRAFT_192253 [Hypoxylon sp. FL1857]
MESQEPVFHPFPRLPAELRLAIWRECLPHRVVELQCPCEGLVFDYYQEQLEPSACVTSLVPLPSRRVAALTMTTGDNHWEHPLTVRDPWVDTARDVIHMHYETPWDKQFDRPKSGNPLRHAAWAASRTTSNQVSFNIMLLLRTDFLYEHIIKLLHLRSSWLVVVYLAVVHMDHEAAAATGLFGVLGDAPVQIVDLRDKARVNAFNTLVLTNKQRKPSAGQPLMEEEVQRGVWSMEYAMTQLFKDELEPAPAVDPVVMFRLCTEKCYDPRRSRGRKG